ncbi:uncharacterized protein IUM83_01330 [Phytophthora cinnamomi]|uniref:uncharacterized protein n=1 Tax=Phytophthora cinnamomi TaxID=4785 RepID=UPI003559587E|nr:hypothetical protein IUM83_01330 [Phytophthora cinnamomi]
MQEERAAIPAGADGSDTPLGDEECQHSPPIGSKAVVRTSDGKGGTPAGSTAEANQKAIEAMPKLKLKQRAKTRCGEETNAVKEEDVIN